MEKDTILQYAGIVYDHCIMNVNGGSEWDNLQQLEDRHFRESENMSPRACIIGAYVLAIAGDLLKCRLDLINLESRLEEYAEREPVPLVIKRLRQACSVN
jgi:hypothetical protein